MKLLISTGEVSGDVVGARLAAEILRRVPDATIRGIGGSHLRAAGVELDLLTNDLGTVGVSESLAAAPHLVRAIHAVRRSVRETPPDAAVLIGNDIFNVILGRWLRRRGVPVIGFFPPQVWIWRSLAWLFSRSYDTIATSFPEEQQVYQRHCDGTVFVGHYLADALHPPTPDERREARQALGFSGDESVVAVMPGSRKQELNSLTTVFLDTVALLSSRRATRFVLPVSDEVWAPLIERELARRDLAGRVVVTRRSHEAMRAADALLAASGTASLEATLLGLPMVVAYRVSSLTLNIVRLAIRAGLMDSETIALPNLILGREAVVEVKQREVTPERLAGEVERLCDDAILRSRLRADLAEASERVAAHGSVARVADLVLARARGESLTHPDVALPAALAESRVRELS